MSKAISPFRELTAKIGHQIHKIQADFDALLELIDRDFSEANELAFCLAAECEKLTLMARSLPLESGRPRSAGRMEQVMLENFPVEIRVNESGQFHMSFPALLPRKERGSPEYIRGALYPAMRRFFDGRPRVHFRNCVVIFRHVYNRRRPARRYRDHDNIEVNAVVDLLALFLLDDDAPLFCSHFYTSAQGEADRTEVVVLAPSEFPRWLYGEKTAEKGALPIRENPP